MSVYNFFTFPNCSPKGGEEDLCLKVRTKKMITYFC